MVTLSEKLNNDLREALIKKNKEKVETLRMLLSGARNKAIELLKKDSGLNDEEMILVFKSEIKKRKDSIELYEKGGRSDLAEKEKAEIEIIKVYLPPELSDEEIRKMVKEAIASMGNVEIKDFGKIMKEVMPKLKGQADGAKLSAIVKEEISKL